MIGAEFMATSEKIDADYDVRLTLSKKEAEFLLSVTGAIGGDPYTSRMKYASAIRRALLNVVHEEISNDFTGALSFADWVTQR